MVQIDVANNVCAVDVGVSFIRDLKQCYSLESVSHPARLPQSLSYTSVEGGINGPNRHLLCQLLQLGICSVQNDRDRYAIAPATFAFNSPTITES